MKRLSSNTVRSVNLIIIIIKSRSIYTIGNTQMDFVIIEFLLYDYKTVK